MKRKTYIFRGYSQARGYADVPLAVVTLEPDLLGANRPGDRARVTDLLTKIRDAIAGSAALAVTMNRQNPRTLVHAGMAQVAQYHVLSGRGAPLADLYVGKRWAKKVASVLAGFYGEPVKLIEHVGYAEGRTVWDEPTELVGAENPAAPWPPLVHEDWHNWQTGETATVRTVRGNRAELLSHRSGMRFWMDRADLLASWRPVGRGNPGFVFGQPIPTSGIVGQIRPGDRVTIVNRFGQERTGRAVMPSSHGGWVLNMGGRHGTPGIADESNIVRVTRPKRNPRGRSEGQPFPVGTRVELHPATDDWMRGDRYGQVVGYGLARQYVDTFSKQITTVRPVRVKLDKSGKIVRLHPESMWPVNAGARRRELSVPERHQLRIARDTLKLHPAMVPVMGGMTVDEAKAIIYRLTGSWPRENPPPVYPFGGKIAADGWLELTRAQWRAVPKHRRDYAEAWGNFAETFGAGVPYVVGNNDLTGKWCPMFLAPVRIVDAKDMGRRKPRGNPRGAVAGLPESHKLTAKLVRSLGFNAMAREILTAKQGARETLRYMLRMRGIPESRKVLLRAALQALEREARGLHYVSSAAELEGVKREAFGRLSRELGRPVRVPNPGQTLRPAPVAAHACPPSPGTHPECAPAPAGGNPLQSWVDPRSIRTVRSGRALVRVGCPRRHFHPLARGRRKCDVGTRAVEILSSNRGRLIRERIKLLHDVPGLGQSGEVVTGEYGSVPPGFGGFAGWEVMRGGRVFSLEEGRDAERIGRENPEPIPAEAAETFRMWHERDPKHVKRVRVPSRTIPRHVVKLGEVTRIDYRSDKWNPGRVVTYTHATRAPRPILVTGPGARGLHIIGGRIRVTPDGLVN